MPLLNDFSQKLDRRFSRAYQNQSMAEWVCANTTLDGQPFSFEHYEFQKALLNDMHPNLSCIKCSQVGLTEVQIRKALGFITRNRGVALIFSLPDDKLFRRVSQTRVQPLLLHDKIFNLEGEEDSVRSMSITQIGHSFMYLTSCTEADATSTAADAVFNDELDLSDDKMIRLFNSRMQNSDYKIRQMFSTPTFAGGGIDQAYQSSDQHKYLHRCPACGHWQWPEFNLKFCHFPDLPKHIEDLVDLNQDDINNMDLSKGFLRCEKCFKPLAGAKREWVPTFSGRVNSRGYWVTPFSTDRISVPYIAAQLIEYKKGDYLRGWYNTVLGQTYADARAQIPLDSINEAMRKGSEAPIIPSDRPLAIGIDVGQTCHLVLGDAVEDRIYSFESLTINNLKNRVKELQEKYKIVSGGIDRLPYTPTANEIFEASKFVILPIQYETAKDSDMKLVMDKLEKLSHGAINRTKILDIVADSFRNYQIILSGYTYQKEIITQQLRNMVRQEEPEKPAVWVKLQGSATMDHYFHAIAFMKAGLRLRPLVLEALSSEVGETFGVMVASVQTFNPLALPGSSPRSVSRGYLR